MLLLIKLKPNHSTWKSFTWHFQWTKEQTSCLYYEYTTSLERNISRNRYWFTVIICWNISSTIFLSYNANLERFKLLLNRSWSIEKSWYSSHHRTDRENSENFCRTWYSANDEADKTYQSSSLFSIIHLGEGCNQWVFFSTVDSGGTLIAGLIGWPWCALVDTTLSPWEGD